jgi:hypothetical protein
VCASNALNSAFSECSVTTGMFCQSGGSRAAGITAVGRTGVRARRPPRRPALFEAALRDSRQNGGNRAVASAILGLACLATDAADWHRAAALHGSAQAIHDQAGMH